MEVFPVKMVIKLAASLVKPSVKAFLSPVPIPKSTMKMKRPSATVSPIKPFAKYCCEWIQKFLSNGPDQTYFLFRIKTKLFA